VFFVQNHPQNFQQKIQKTSSKKMGGIAIIQASDLAKWKNISPA